MTKYQATWSEGVLRGVTTYDHDIAEKPYVNEFRQVRPTSEECGYWVVDSNGTTYGFQSVDGQGCIASLEDAFRGLGLSAYVIWQCKDHTEKGWQRWCKKWVARMTSATKTGVVSCC